MEESTASRMEKSLESEVEKEITVLARGLPDEILERGVLTKLRKNDFPYIALEEFKDSGFAYLSPEQKIMMKDTLITVREGRKKCLGYEGVCEGYHTSPADLEVGSQIGVGEDGKAYYSDQYSLYSRWGTVNFVYLVSADAKLRDEKEPLGCNGRFYARSPLTILRKWPVKKFMEEHPGASFRSC